MELQIIYGHWAHDKIKIMGSYRVKWKVDNSIAGDTLNLPYASESAAIEELKRRGTVRRDKNIIILSIDPT